MKVFEGRASTLEELPELGFIGSSIQWSCAGKNPNCAEFVNFLFVKESTVAYGVGQDKSLSRACFYLGRTGTGPLMKDLTGGNMGVSDILAQIDREIAQLQRARALLVGKATPKPKKAAAAPAARKQTKKKRNLTPDGRKRIADAVKRRWAEQKKASSGD